MPQEKPQPPPNRRGFLKFVSLKALTGLAQNVPLLGWGPLLGSGKNPIGKDLPGEGSIFQPRQDQRLQEWLKKHPRKDSE